MSFRSILVAAILWLAAPAFATPQQYDGNDLWLSPGESGWGLNLFHQGDTLFGSLFVYGPDGRARWYTASNLVGIENAPVRDHPTHYSGPLVESTGPAVGGAFDPARVTRRQVGTMSIEFGRDGSVPGAQARNYAYVWYDIDGVMVSKVVYPFGFVPLGLTGSYTGFVAAPTGARDDFNANITLNNGAFAMSMTTSASGSCTYTGQQEPQGSLFSVRGTFSCSNGTSNQFQLYDVDVTRHGFTAKVFINGASWQDLAAQRNSSPIRGDGYSTDLWLAPGESGWGLNIVEQGDTLFGTLFVYDAQGRSRWYSASNLVYEQCAPADAASDCNGRYRGALVESTGPYFGTSFNSAAVQRRQVGTMTFETYGNNTAYVEYSIDGVTVPRKALSRFAFRANSLAGTYAGYMRTLDGANPRGVLLGPMNIDVSESGDSIVMTMRSSDTCTLRGTRSQYGRQVMASGAYDCSAGRIGQLQLMDVYVTFDGFTASFSLDGSPMGRISAVRTTPH